MRRAHRLDANHTEIVEALTPFASVQSLASLGFGVLDLLVGLRGHTYLVEIKDGSKPPSRRRLTDAERDFVATWTGGPIVVLKSADEALTWVQAAIAYQKITNSPYQQPLR